MKIYQNIYLKIVLKILVKNVLYSTALISQKFYPDAHVDYPDKSLLESNNIIFKILVLSHLVRIFLLERMLK